jgi:hypothetical protein
LIEGPALVSAATGGGGGPVFATITVAVGASAPLTAKLIAKVPVDITCTLTQAGIDAGASTTPDFSFVNVQLTEAVTKTTIAQSEGGGGAFICDGGTSHLSIAVTSYNAPFKGGKALVQVMAEADRLPFDPDTGQVAGSAFLVTEPTVIHPEVARVRRETLDGTPLDGVPSLVAARASRAKIQ